MACTAITPGQREIWDASSKIALRSFEIRIALCSNRASQAACPTLPYNLANGQVADASQVMANYEALRDCIDDVGVIDPGLASELAVYDAGGVVLSGAPLSEILDEVGNTQGSILFRGASEWQTLSPGTAGYVLQSGGLGADPSWVAGAAGGGITTIVGGGVAAGTSTVAIPKLAPVSRPALSAFSWVNQASATSTEYANVPLVLKT